MNIKSLNDNYFDNMSNIAHQYVVHYEDPECEKILYETIYDSYRTRYEKLVELVFKGCNFSSNMSIIEMVASGKTDNTKLMLVIAQYFLEGAPMPFRYIIPKSEAKLAIIAARNVNNIRIAEYLENYLKNIHKN